MILRSGENVLPRRDVARISKCGDVECNVESNNAMISNVGCHNVVR